VARFKVTLEYEGTRYRGWQLQKNARTVQGEIEKAIAGVFGTDEYEFVGSGRTDAGVHALRQVAHLDVRTMLAPEIIRMKVNDQLPPDINILDVEKTHPRFHARHHAVARRYLYQISRRRTAFGKRFVWWIKDDLSVQNMREALTLFSGMKDLRSFTDDAPEEKSTSVLIHQATIDQSGSLIIIGIRGSHFLWKLVRRIVGVVVEVGRGSLRLRDIETFLRDARSDPARFTAPPSGLFLEHVYYEDDKEDEITPLRAVLPVGEERMVTRRRR
jgi:tRNA pseudouridine38-40 synthase